MVILVVCPTRDICPPARDHSCQPFRRLAALAPHHMTERLSGRRPRRHKLGRDVLRARFDRDRRAPGLQRLSVFRSGTFGVLWPAGRWQEALGCPVAGCEIPDSTTSTADESDLVLGRGRRFFCEARETVEREEGGVSPALDCEHEVTIRRLRWRRRARCRRPTRQC